MSIVGHGLAQLSFSLLFDPYKQTLLFLAYRRQFTYNSFSNHSSKILQKNDTIPFMNYHYSEEGNFANLKTHYQQGSVMFKDSMKDTFNFFTTHWWALMLLALPVVLADWVIKYWLGPLEIIQDTWPMQISGAGWPGVGVYFVGLFLASVLGQIAVILFTHSAVKGQGLSIKQCWSMSFKLWLPMMGLSLLTLLPVMLGFVLLVIPGIIVWVRLLVAPYIFILEGRGALASLTESWKRTKGCFWVIVIGSFIIFLPANVAQQFFGTSASPLELVPTGQNSFMLFLLQTFLSNVLVVYLYRIYSLIEDSGQKVAIDPSDVLIDTPSKIIK
jgi:hypothetical protein